MADVFHDQWQIRKGDMKGAAVGIERLKKRISKEDMDNADSSR